MTTHAADRPADSGSVEENEELGANDGRTDEQYDLGTVTDAEMADADMGEPVEDEPETTRSHQHDAVDDDTDAAEDVEPEPIATDEADEPAKPEPPDESDRIDAIAVDRPAKSDPLQKLAPVGPDTPVDPGTGSYQDRWGAIQAGFIDDPGRTVESASALVAEIWDKIERSITDERGGIESRWQRTESSTDDLRGVMQDYRALCDRFMRFTSN